MDKSKEKEKLMGLIVDAKRADPETGSFTEWLAAFLLDHGVMVPADDGPGADRLRELIQADREGLTVRLLFKVGDKVYETFCGRIVEKQIIAITFLISKSEGRVCYHAENARHAVTTIDSKDVGETVFPTREEAEAALAKRRSRGRPGQNAGGRL